MRRHGILAAATAAILVLVPACGSAEQSAAEQSGTSAQSSTTGTGLPSTDDLPEAGPDEVHLFAFNDFHGNLEPPSGSTGRIGDVEAGGAAYLATHLKRLREAYPNSAVIAGGDNVGASPLISSLFADEPTIDFLNMQGVSASTVGNHEFDRGVLELERLQAGGCAPSGCEPGEPFTGAAFQYLAANVTNDQGQPPVGLQPWTMLEIDGRRIAVVGAVTTETPRIVFPEGIRGYTFGDEADAINRYVPDMRAAGAEAIVAYIHEGGAQEPSEGTTADPNSCDNLDGPIVGINQRLDPAVTAVLSAHTHQFYACTVDGRPLTQAASYGRLITDLTLHFGSDGVQASAVNRAVTRTVAPDVETRQLIDFYAAEAAPRASRPVGSIAVDLTRDEYPGGDTPLGNVIADAMLAATRAPDPAEAVIAFMNPGGVRADLTAGEVTFGDAYTVQPFGNQIVTVSLTGTQILDLLEQQWQDPQDVAILDVAGMTYRYDPAADAGAKVDRASVLVGGAPLNPVAVYPVATNNFLASGGDGFTVFTSGTDEVVGRPDLDVFEAYLQANPNLGDPGPRITAG
ncbi:bifunctional metallophosphatase/5'-nucleotidase [Millisia brevis]|uniref:bifunctional metallophosphatase/5'-nucleotidase n=1 Tax=Millisia brevis TaxID=264148 RepID=UPI000832465E|nr:bifunctional metallophosphatase/5'-nucleotidase [Millisia brevis]